MNRDELALTLAQNFSNHPEIKNLLEKCSKKLTFKKNQIERLQIVHRRANLSFDPNQIESEEKLAEKLADIIMKKSYFLADEINRLTN